MLAFLSHLLRHSTTPLGEVVHIGAGVGRELEVYENLSFQRIIAVEPNPSLFSKLDRKAKRYENVKTVKQWIAPTSGKVTVHQYANPRFNSLLKGGKLAEHFSNLANSEPSEVKAVGINEFLSDLTEIEPKLANVLVLDVQGAEMLLLDACAPQWLSTFEWVCVRTSKDSLYEQGGNTKVLSEFMVKQNFELRLYDAEHVPFVEQFYQLNKVAFDLQLAHESLKANTDEVEALKAQNQTLTTVNGELQESTRALRDEKEALQKTMLAISEEKETLQTRIDKVSNIVEQKHQQIVELEAKNKQYEKLLTETEKTIDGYISQIAALKQSLQEAADKSESTTSQVDILNSEKAELQTALESTQSELKVAVEKCEAHAEQTTHLQEKIDSLNNDKEHTKENTLELLKQLEDTKHEAESIQQAHEATVSGLQQQLVEWQTQLEETQNQLDLTRAQLEEQTKWHHDNKKWAEGLQVQLADKSAKYDKLQCEFNMASSLSSKAILKVQNDLDHLRIKYDEKLKSESRLITLINQLKLKLEAASEYYLELEKSYPEITQHDSTSAFESGDND